GLLHPVLPAAGAANARLDAVRVWAERMEGSRAKDSWERVYHAGHNFFRALCAINEFIEHYGTGGGLCRPLFADFLTEAAAILARPDLADLGMQYAELGHAWSTLADTALPDAVPLLREAKALLTRQAVLLHMGAAADEHANIRQRMAQLEQQAALAFPLSGAECRDLRIALRQQIAALHAAEVAAHAVLGACLGV
ncbi:MAG TPA: DUF4872 domain-containing protein, partial [Roseiflexaceae bacterium]|nr:DUF4872 domain-containing protein [Roseiflexaceae bacterium]